MSDRRPTVVPAGARLAAKAKAERSASRRRTGRRLAWGAATLGSLALFAWVLLVSPLLAVRSVSVTGTALLTPAQVREAADVVTGTPLARVDLSAVVRRVAALAPVAEVQVRRGWPGTLRVRVIERVAVAGTLTPTGFLLVDGDGVPFAPAKALPPGVVRLQVARAGPADPTTKAALRVLADLPPPIRTRVRIVRAASPSSVTLVLQDGKRVLWGGVGDTALKLQAAEALLKMPGTVYDVSRPGVVTRR